MSESLRGWWNMAARRNKFNQPDWISSLPKVCDMLDSALDACEAFYNRLELQAVRAVMLTIRFAGFGFIVYVIYRAALAHR
jgi:hypothetical protein